MGHDAAVGLLGSYVATETCRSAAEAKMNAGAGEAAAVSGDDYLLGMDDDELFDDDVLGIEAELEAEHSMNFAYGW